VTTICEISLYCYDNSYTFGTLKYIPISAKHESQHLFYMKSLFVRFIQGAANTAFQLIIVFIIARFSDAPCTCGLQN